MKQAIFSTQIHSRNTWIGVVTIIFVVIYGFVTSLTAAAQGNVRAIDSMYTCIDRYNKKAEASAKTSSGEREFRSTLRNETLKGVKDRKEHLNKQKFSDSDVDKEYRRLDKLVDTGNKNLGDSRVVKPKYHMATIQAERDNLLAQLDRKAEIARDPNITTNKLVENHCETSWGLRALAVAGRKWRAQVNTDTLSTRNAIAKAYWAAAQKPKDKDPSQFDEQIAQFQRYLDETPLPRTGIVGVSTLNPKNGDAKNAFQKHMYDPQKQLRKEIVANSQKLQKAMTPRVVKPTKKNKYGYVQLPANNELYYIYGSSKAKTGDGGATPSYQRYGKPALVAMFQDVAVQFRKKYPETKLVVGDLNAIAGHASHKNGVDIDVYAQDHMAADMRGAHRNAKSVERTVALGKLFMDTRKIDVIFYNDPAVIRKVNAYAQQNNLPGRMESSNSTHEFHFHVRIKDRAGPYDNCARSGAARDCF